MKMTIQQLDARFWERSSFFLGSTTLQVADLKQVLYGISKLWMQHAQPVWGQQLAKLLNQGKKEDIPIVCTLSMVAAIFVSMLLPCMTTSVFEHKIAWYNFSGWKLVSTLKIVKHRGLLTLNCAIILPSFYFISVMEMRVVSFRVSVDENLSI